MKALRMKYAYNLFNHLLIYSDLASHIWRRANNKFDIGWSSTVNVSGVLSYQFDSGKPKSSEFFYKVVVPLLVLLGVQKKRCRHRLYEGYIVRESQKEAIVKKVLYWVVRLHKGFTPKSPSSSSFKQRASMIGIKRWIFSPNFQNCFV